MPALATNANSTAIAALMKDARVGTFTGLITRKKGVTRGKKGAKVVYGDATVHTVIFTGFKYDALVERSLAQVRAMTDADLDTLVPADASFTREDLDEAKTAVELGFETTLDPSKGSTSTTKHVYEPLTVNGETVRGCRVYRCTGTEGCHCRDCNPDDKRAPLDGTIYVQGLRIWSKVIEPPANGYWQTKSKPLTLAKDALRALLPVSRYVQYALEPGTDFILRAGGTAAVKASQDGFTLDDATLGGLLAA